ncbi:amino acid adenylation domain-containing protein [Candidatus Uabimicrobium sp. HlEnr_7]|uniref:non-ribosomal peptide synthetase n=1 Tax=Candidatus Uabimicrobium helgolandensis TaxID=3095367 RepID=UPI003558BB93
MNIIKKSDQLKNINLALANDAVEQETESTTKSKQSPLVSDPERKISKIDLLSTSEYQKLVNVFNATDKIYPNCEQTIPSLFQLQVTKTPNSTALIFEEEQWSYDKLNNRANQLAHYLQKQGATVETMIGISLPRSSELVVALLAVLKVGAAYVPMDSNFPQERLDYILRDSQVTFTIDHNFLIKAVSSINEQSCCNLIIESSFELKNTAAYMIYTSGSTGQPKGVINSHLGVVNRLLWMQEHYQLTEQDAVLQKTPISFDVSVWELFWPLLTGARLVMAKPEGHKDPSYLARIICDKRITTIHFVPSMLQIFVNQVDSSKLKSLKNTICSGEVLSVSLQNAFLNKIPGKLYNLYGPTEAAIDVSYWQCQVGCSNVPIGQPIANIRLYILDNNLDLVSVGVAGQLYISGVGVARGYWNKAALTAQKFIPNPFGRELGEIMYQTGDLARWLPDGNIEYLGRIDFQVKIRGFRIELGEIENKLLTIPQIAKAIVTAVEYNGDKVLVAYIEKYDLEDISSKDISELLQTSLPDYMIPPHIVEVKFTLNHNGKIDRKTLPQITPQKSESNFVVYTNEVENDVLKIWQNLLGIFTIKMEDDFFQLGGNSLLATQLLFEVQREFRGEISLDDIYKNQTFGKFCNLVRGIECSGLDSNIVLLKSGSRRPLFLVPDLGGDTASYRHIVEHLDSEQTIYSFRPAGQKDDQNPIKTISGMADFYIELMKKIQPHGPYIIGGLSMAGSVAYEMAQKLTAQQEKVPILVLFDADSGLGFNKDSMRSLIDIFKFMWERMFISVFRPTKMSRKRIKKTASFIKLAWQAEINEEDCYVCETEEEQRQQILSQLKNARKFPPYVTLQQFQKISQLSAINYLSTFCYFPRKYLGKILFFKPTQKTQNFTCVDYEKWKSLARKGLTLYEIPGDHFNFFLNPSAKEIARKLQYYIDNELDL